ncbi:hypothetical protein KXD40_007574 [Peronospora effusa]|nr:hypothetical protein KXD40_007574 [Peronospora effusa]
MAEDRTEFDPVVGAEASSPPISIDDNITGVTASVPTDAPPQPKPKATWITVPLRAGRRRFEYKNKPARKHAEVSTRYEALSGKETEAGVDEEQEMQGLRGEESEIIEVSVTEVITETPVRTPTEMSQLRILKKNPPPILAEPQLMGLLQRERSHLLGLIAPSQTEIQPLANN